MKTKILIIDDDPGVQDVLQLIFERAGYEVTIESDGRFILEDKYKCPDVFLVDRYLSGIDGLDICRHLKESPHCVGIPVIMVSASPDIEKLAIAAGADGFVEKPFNMAHLVNTIENTLKKAYKV